MEAGYDGSDWGSRGPYIRGFAAVCATMQGSRSGLTAAGDCADSGWRQPERCGQGCRRHAADRAGLGAPLKRGRAQWSGDAQITRAYIDLERRAACSPDRGSRSGSDPCGA